MKIPQSTLAALRRFIVYPGYVAFILLGAAWLFVFILGMIGIVPFSDATNDTEIGILELALVSLLGPVFSLIGICSLKYISARADAWSDQGDSRDTRRG